MMGTRFTELAHCNLDAAAAKRVTEVADVFVAWLRRVKSVRMTLVAIEEIDDPSVFVTPTEGAAVTNIDTSQRAHYVLDATDDRGFSVGDAPLAARISNESVATLEFIEAAVSASGKDEVIATFAGTLGTATIEVFATDAPDVVLGADVLVANPGEVKAVTMTATVEEIPAPEAPVEEPPAEEPAPEV